MVDTLEFYYYNGYDWTPMTSVAGRYLTFSGVYITDYLVGNASAGNTVVHEPDFRLHMYIENVPSAGSMVFLFRRQDANNHWSIRITAAGALTLRETVASAGTTRGTSATAVQDGDRITITAEGQQIDIYINSSLVISYATAATFTSETVAQVSSLGTAGLLANISTWLYDDDGLYSGINVGDFQGGMHIWDDVPGVGAHICEVNGTGHPANVQRMSSSSMSLNGAAEAVISDGNLAEEDCIRITLSLYPAGIVSGARFYCYDGIDTEIPSPGVEVHAFERGIGVGYWTLINSGIANIGGDRFGSRMDLHEKTTPSVSHTWHVAISVSPEYYGNIVPYFGAAFYWS